MNGLTRVSMIITQPILISFIRSARISKEDSKFEISSLKWETNIPSLTIANGSNVTQNEFVILLQLRTPT